MEKGKPAIMLIFAIIISLIVTLMSYKWLQGIKKKTKDKPLETQQIAVAAFDLSWGITINKEMVKLVPFLSSSLPPGTFSDMSLLLGRTLIYPLKTNEPIFEWRLAPVDIKTGGVAAIITPEKRAISVKVDKVVGVSGFIYPGHRVDVLTTLRGRGMDRESTTKTVLENILVLSAGKEMERTDKHEKPTEVDVITLEVTPEEGEKLVLAATEGKILLALRSFSDTKEVVTSGVTITDLLASYAASKSAGSKKKPVKKSSGGRTRVQKSSCIRVELIKGSEISTQKFEKGKGKYAKTGCN